MDFYAAVNGRRTIRDFTGEPIGDEALERIIASGMKAPSNDHMRDWHFVVVDDKDVVRKCLEKIPKKFSDEYIDRIIRDWQLRDDCQQSLYRSAIPKQYAMLYDAGVMVVPLFKEKTDILNARELSQLNGFASIWCCIENMFLASVAEGFACTLRIPLGDEAEWTRGVLGFPNDYFMPCFMAIGKPQQDVKPVKQKEFSIKERIHRNKW